MRWFSFEAFTVFVGVLFILFGVSLILKSFWNIDIPLFRIGVALFLIYLGLGLIFQPPWRFCRLSGVTNDVKERTWLFASSRATLDEDVSKVNAVFSSLEADFSSLKKEGKRIIQCNVVFGSLVVILPADLPVKIEGHAVFGSVELPDKRSTSFGSLSSDVESGIVIVAHAVFGSIEFKVQ